MYRLRTLLGIGLTAYGLLALIGPLHDTVLFPGTTSLGFGAVLMAPALPVDRLPRATWIALVGAGMVLMVVGPALLLGLPLRPLGWGFIAYGTLLLALSRGLHRPLGPTTIRKLAEVSLALVLAPLLLVSIAMFGGAPVCRPDGTAARDRMREERAGQGVATSRRLPVTP